MNSKEVISLTRSLGHVLRVAIGPKDYYVAMAPDGELTDRVLYAKERYARLALADYWMIPQDFIGGDDA